MRGYYEANRALLPDKILAINGSTEPAVMAGMMEAVRGTIMEKGRL